MLQCLKKAGLACAVLCASLVKAAYALPPGFAETPIGGPWNEVSGVAFSADGTRLYVVERGGTVWIVENGVKLETPLLDIHDAVGAWRDYGMLGFALHPNFDQNGYFYAWYVVDRYYLYNHDTPGYNPALLESQQFQATIGRLSRFTADPATGRRTVLPGSEVILIGATPQDGLPILHESHGTGQLVFGQDGTLLVSGGEGASYGTTDTGSADGTWYAQALAEGIIEPEENVGAWRAQQVDSLSGKILRIDPNTGAGIASNPWYDPAAPTSPRSRVYAVGLRNPYRFTLRPGTGSHDPEDGDPGTFYVGDVGWGDSEDLQILSQPGQNFGWPAFEGPNHRSIFPDSTYWDAGTPNPRTKNPLASQPGCTVPFLRFRDLIIQETQNPSNPPSWPNPCNPAVQIPNSWVDPSDGKLYRYEKFIHSRPPISWRISAAVATFDPSGNPTIATLGEFDSPIPGANFGGATSTAGVWYTGTDFPEEWRNTYFHGDYTAGWIKNFGFDENDQIQDVVNFIDEGTSVTFITTNPVSGGLYYVNWGDSVFEVRWVGTGNTPPTAVALPKVSWSTGNSLNVQFDGSNSSDPDPGAVLSYLWAFGDGATSTQQSPQHTFTWPNGAPHTFSVGLNVTDEDTNADGDVVKVYLNNSPPNVEMTSPVDGGLYSMAGPTNVTITSSVSDAEHATPTLGCALLVELMHNTHTHQEPLIPSCSATVPISPVGCDGNTYRWRFTLTVTDPEGLAASDSATLYPDCSTLPNEPPVALSDIGIVASGAQVALDVLGNDTDSDGAVDATSVAIATLPTAGTVDVNPVTGVITYQNGGTGTADSFTYTVDDDDGETSNAATVSLIVLPQPSDLEAAWAFDEPAGSIAMDLSGNGNDGTLTGPTRTLEGHSGGALVFDGVDDLVLVPDSSSLDLQTAMTLEAWVYPTSALSGWRMILNKQADAYFLDVLDNHAGVGGRIGGGPCCSLLESPGTPPANQWTHIAGTYDGSALRLYLNGTLVGTLARTGNIMMTSSSLRIGASADTGEVFPGRIDDVRIYSRSLSAAEIQGDMLSSVNGTPTALADSKTVAEGASSVIAVAANDHDPENALDLDSIQIVTPPAHGSLGTPGGGSVSYTHDGGETTSDSFTYTIRDAVGWISNTATVSITITPMNDPPVAADDSGTAAEGGIATINVAANDSDAEGALNLGSIQIGTGPAHGSVQITGGGSVTYTHDGGETTSDSFTYTIRDAANAPSNAATVSITVTPVNDPPVAAGDSGSVGEGQSTSINVAANDSDAEGALNLGSIQIGTGPAHGSVQIQGGGSVLYTHDGSETTSDAFTYTIRDAANAPSNAATVAVTVTPANDPPVAAPDSATVVEGSSVLIGLTANDSDAEGPLNLGSIQIASPPAHGTIDIEGGGAVTYTHDGGPSTSDSFTYTVRDAAGTPSNAATVSITVTQAPEVPAVHPGWVALALGASGCWSLARRSAAARSRRVRSAD